MTRLFLTNPAEGPRTLGLRALHATLVNRLLVGPRGSVELSKRENLLCRFFILRGDIPTTVRELIPLLWSDPNLEPGIPENVITVTIHRLNSAKLARIGLSILPASGKWKKDGRVLVDISQPVAGFVHHTQIPQISPK